MSQSPLPLIGQLEGQILSELVNSAKTRTALELQGLIVKRDKKYSLPGIYKVLNKLREQGVVYKERDNFGLSLNWIINISKFSESLVNTHIYQASYKALLPNEAQKTTWHFSNLLQYDDFWIHLLHVMLKGSESQVLYQWIPHPWFHIFQSEKGVSLVEALEAKGNQIFNIIGGDSYLDRRAGDITSENIYEYTYAEGPFQSRMDLYYSVCGDYILTHKLDAQSLAKIDKLFARVKSQRDIVLPEVMELIRNPVKVRLTLENNARKANMLNKKFVDYFGHSNLRK